MACVPIVWAELRQNMRKAKRILAFALSLVVVFSGINSGYNTGIDILYSGTVGAAMEALANGIRSFAFSNKNDTSWETADAYLISIVKELLDENLSMDRIWNVNFPGCKLSEYIFLQAGNTERRPPPLRSRCPLRYVRNTGSVPAHRQL